MIEFSINEADKDKDYIKRPGAYGLIKNHLEAIAIIKTKTGYFLPGGGLDDQELLDECLRRECLEEIGAEIIVLDNFACGNYYFYSTKFNVHMESVGYFFVCKINKFLDVLTEDDHELVWLEPEEAIKLLYLDNQREAVRIFKDTKFK